MVHTELNTDEIGQKYEQVMRRIIDRKSKRVRRLSSARQALSTAYPGK